MNYDKSGRYTSAVGIDIGGTFTDLVSFDSETREVNVIKTFTTPEDPSRGFMDAIDRCPVKPTSVGTFITHGSTTALDTILTRSGAKVGFLSTRGHRDILDIGRAFREGGTSTTQAGCAHTSRDRSFHATCVALFESACSLTARCSGRLMRTNSRK